MAALGLLLLAVAGLTALVGALANSGADHLINGGFAIFGYHVTGSTGRLFLYGAIVGAVAMLGLNMLLGGIGRGFKQRVTSRRKLKQSRREGETLQQERDRLARELEEERGRRDRAEAEGAAPAASAGAGTPVYPTEVKDATADRTGDRQVRAVRRQARPSQ